MSASYPRPHLFQRDKDALSTAVHVGSSSTFLNMREDGEIEEQSGFIVVPPPPVLHVCEFSEPFELHFKRLFAQGQRHFSVIHFDPTFYVKWNTAQSFPTYTADEKEEFVGKLFYCLAHYTRGEFYISGEFEQNGVVFYSITSEAEEKAANERLPLE